MRTNIQIDDKLLKYVMKGYGFDTKKEAVHQALEKAAQTLKQREALKFMGKLHWKGDLDALRRN